MLLETSGICDTSGESPSGLKDTEKLDLVSQVAFISLATWMQYDSHSVYPKFICNKKSNSCTKNEQNKNQQKMSTEKNLIRVLHCIVLYVKD